MRQIFYSFLFLASAAFAFDAFANGPQGTVDDCGSSLNAVQKDEMYVNSDSVNSDTARSAPTYFRYNLWSFNEVSTTIDPQVLGFSTDLRAADASVDLVLLEAGKKTVKKVLAPSVALTLLPGAQSAEFDGRQVRFIVFEFESSLYDLFAPKLKKTSSGRSTDGGGTPHLRIVIKSGDQTICQKLVPFKK